MSNRDVALFSRRQSPSPLCRTALPALNYVGLIERGQGELFHHALHIDPPEVTELMLIRKGRGQFLFGGKHFTAGQGDLIIYNAGIWHEERSVVDSPFRTVFVNFSGLQIEGLPPGFLISPDASPIVGLGSQYFPIEQRFSEIYNLVEAAMPEYNYIADHLLGALIGEIVAALAGPKERRSEEKIRAMGAVPAVRRYIHENYHTPVNLAQLGVVGRISPYHLCRVFREQTGSSPIEYLINYRVEMAKLHLRTTDHKIATIAGLVGYQSETQFQAIFRKIVGIAPGKYRINCRQDGYRASI